MSRGEQAELDMFLLENLTVPMQNISHLIDTIVNGGVDISDSDLMHGLVRIKTATDKVITEIQVRTAERETRTPGKAARVHAECGIVEALIAI